MNFNTQLLFFFSALGAFNGLAMGIYFLLYAKPKHISNRFLGGLLIILSVRIGKSVFFYFNPNLADFYLQLGLSACFFIGPFLYFYIQSIMKPNSNINVTWKYHMIIWMPLMILVGFSYPFHSNIETWRYYIIPAIYFQWLVYCIISGYKLQPLFMKTLKRSEKLKSIEIWMLSIFIGNLLILIAFYSFRYTYYIVGALSFSFIIYLLVLLLLFNKRKHSILFKNAMRYEYKKINQKEALEFVSKLDTIILQEELFKNANLKLPDLANKMGTTVHMLSQLLNDNIGRTFSNFINEYRIEEAKRLIKSNSSLTLEAIGYECGFNSKTTFYTAFKKFTGVTPSKYK